MITLKNLFQSSLQDIFDQAAKHLLTQGKRSVGPVRDFDKDYCRYHSDDGLMCAVGCFISEDEYSVGMEGCTARGLFPPSKFPNREVVTLLERLQHVHDSGEPECWAESLRLVARKEGLNHDVLKEAL